MHTDLLFAEATTAILASWWKMLFIFIPFLGWGWLVSSRLDKDARYFHLNPRRWNAVHLGAGVAALAAMLFIPIFWIGWPVGVLVLLAPILVYWKIRNQSVPEDQQFHFSSQSLGSRLEERKKRRAQRAALLQFTKPDGAQHDSPTKDSPLFSTHMVLEDILGPSIEARATRIDLRLTPKGCAVSQVIDGIRYKRDALAAEQGTALIDYIKSIADLDVDDRRRQQLAEIKVFGEMGEHVLSLTTLGSSGVQQLRLDIDRAIHLRKPVDALGLLPKQLEALRVFEQPHERHGIILIGAPHAHGLTTSAYSLLGRHDAFTANVKSLEREVLAPVDGVDQVHWDAANPDIDYATNLQSILRRDPDIVLVDVLRDRETARIAAEPGMSGPLIYLQQELGRIEDQIRDWVKAVGDVKKATRALRAVTNQRLLRTLCPNCRQGYQPSPAQLKKLNLPAEKVSQLYRAGGKVQVKNKIESCPVCGGTGYLGQTGVFQVLVLDDEGRKHLGGGDLKATLAHARRHKMIYLQEAALSKVVNGETTLEEVLRVTAPSRDGSESGDASAEPVPAASSEA